MLAWALLRRGGGGRLGETLVARVRGFEKQLRLVERAVRDLVVRVFVRLVAMHLQQVRGELPLRKRVVEEVGVVKVSLESSATTSSASSLT